MKTYTDNLLHQISEFRTYKSGWVFHSVKSLQINVYKYNQLKGSSYIALPKMIQNKKACLNIQNKDEKCFLYCIIAHDNPVKNIERENMLKKHVDKYDSSGINYPMALSQIPKFEKQNNKSINVYAHEITFDHETKKQKLSVYPIQLSKNVITKYNECINLLLIKEDKKSLMF